MSAQSTLDKQLAELVKHFHTMDAQGKVFMLGMAASQAERHPARPKPFLTLVHSAPLEPFTARATK